MTLEQYIYTPIFFLYGLLVGSFLNVCIYRLPLGLSVAAGRSFCPRCHHTLYPRDLVPVFSYFLQRRRCRYCSEPISSRYAIVELLTAVLYLLCYLLLGPMSSVITGCLLASALVVVAFIDWDTQEVPDVLHIFILTLSIIHLIIQRPPLSSHLLGFVVVALPMLLLAVTLGGFGGADIKLMAVAGLYLGAGKVLLAALVAVLLGGLWAVWLLLRKKADKKTAIPFCPALAVGILVALLWGNPLIMAYLSLFW